MSTKLPETDYFLNLCDDIIIDILSNLDVESVFACKLVCPRWYSLISSKRFVEQHLEMAANNNKPIVLFTGLSSRTSMFFIDDLGSTAKLVSLKAAKSDEKMMTLQLHGSCNGILLMSSINSRKSVLHNPVTGETVTTPKPASRKLLGIFFDKLNKEYKIIQYFQQGDEFHYSTVGLRRKRNNHPKQLGSFKCRPSEKLDMGVILPTAMCWMVYHVKNRYARDDYNYAINIYESVMVYELDTERLHVISGPTTSRQHDLENGWFHPFARLELLAWENKLVFLEWHGSEVGTQVDVWVLEDLDNVCWVRRQVISLREEFKQYNVDAEFVSNMRVQLLCIINGEMLMSWPKGLFLYNIGSKMIRRMETEPRYCCSRALKHIRSLVSPKLIVQ